VKLSLEIAALSGSLLALTACAAETPSPTQPAAAPAHERAVLVVITNTPRYATQDRPTGFWAAEVALPVNELVRAGLRVDYASPKGGVVPIDPMSDPHNPNGHGKDDPETMAFLDSDAQKSRLATTARLDGVDLARYDAIFFAGGSGAAFDFPADPAVQAAARKMYEGGKVVAAICHGTSALVTVKLSDGKYLLSGKQATGFSNAEEKMSGNLDGALPLSIEDEMKKQGATYTAAEPFHPHVVRDGKLVTAQQPQSAKPLAAEILAAMGP
jgi:putative intracellular protease/amidase